MPGGSATSTPNPFHGWFETIWDDPNHSPTGHSQLQQFLASLAGLTGVIGGPGSARFTDPAQAIGVLDGDAWAVTETGTSTVGREKLTDYQADIPFSAMGGSPSEVAQAESELGTDILDVDYSVDSSNLLRELKYSTTIVKLAGADATGTNHLPISMTTDLHLDDYGIPVAPQLPPASEILAVDHCSRSLSESTCY